MQIIGRKIEGYIDHLGEVSHEDGGIIQEMTCEKLILHLVKV
jgi:hypothetical protein